MNVVFKPANLSIKTDIQRVHDSRTDIVPLSVTENGDYSEAGKAYSPVHVDVAGIVPTGTLDIIENGTFDVTDKANAHVAVKQWDDELKGVLDGTLTALTNLPSGLTKIRPYAFYYPRRLPSGYTEVEYIQSSGTQCINTGIEFQAGIKVVADFQFTSIGASAYPMLIAFNDYIANIVYATDSQYTINKNDSTKFFTADPFEKNTISATFTNTAQGYPSVSATIGGETKSHSRTNAGGARQALILFAGKGSQNYYSFSTGKLYRAEVYNSNNALIGNFIPAKNSNNVYGLYDTVSGSFFTSPQTSGASGTFTGGSEIPSKGAIQSADLSVTEIGRYAFYNNDLSSLTLRANEVVSLGEHALDNTPIASGSGNIYVPSALVNSYKTANGWSNYAAIISAIAAS